MASRSGSDGDDTEDAFDIFEDGLLSIFDERMPAAGDPGQRIHFAHPALPATISYNIPNVHAKSNHLFAHYQWDSGVLLARMIASSSSSMPLPDDDLRCPAADLRNQTVLELGAGTGLPGLVAGCMSAEKVLITDYDDPPLIDTIRANIKEVCPDMLSVRGQGLTWGSEAHVDKALQSFGDETSQGFTRVLAADTLWVSSAHPALLQTMRSLLRRSPDSRILLLAGFHTGRPAISRFFQLAAGELSPDTDGAESVASTPTGSQGVLIPDWEEEQYGGIWERRIDGQTRPWQGTRPKAWRRQTGDASEATQSQDEEMGDIRERAKWIVCASLRWADLQ
ncbi:hypothetical protein V8E36_005999 [Tilletia maclaganii]